MRSFLLIYLSALSISLPLDYQVIPHFGKDLAHLLEPTLQLIGEALNLDQGPRGFAVYSDSLGMYLWFALAIPLALLTQLALKLVSTSLRIFVNQTLEILLTGFLALQLAQYGVQKVYMRQFFPLEGKLLFTPLGELGKDVLFWTTMGTSRLFNVVTGAIELMAGILVLIPRLKALGLMLSTLLLSPILLFNLSFNIDVKLLVILLLGISIVLVSPYLKAIYIAWRTREIRYPTDRFHFKLKGVYWMVVLIVFFEIGCVFHTAITVPDEVPEGSLMSRSFTVVDPPHRTPIRLHFHGSGYLIEEYENAEFHPIPMVEDRSVQVIRLTDHEEVLRYTNHGDTIWLSGSLNSNEITWKLVEVDLKRFPLKQDGIRWVAH